jgi:AraC family transcriptional regulator of adaptative response/methylated-DNA-[protein]-cysteine methyltransferase
MERIVMAGKRPAKLDEESCWRALLSGGKDAAEGDFLYGVITTGVFCRPGCKARRPRRENVRFFRSIEEARRAGLRPCKRCKPEGEAPEAERAGIVARACRRIEEAEYPPTLTELAEEAGLSPFHFHRLFKAGTGVTPKDYAMALTKQRMRDGLAAAGSVTEAIYDAGYSSSSRFYEKAEGTLGMAPKTYREGGNGVHIRYAVASCWLGQAIVAATEKGICALFFGEDERELVSALRERFPAARIEPGGESLSEWLEAALKAVEEPERAAKLPLDIRGTAFQQRVWRALRDIPPGKTATYTDIARSIGDARAVRAVAGACAANPVAVAIPCHRIIRSDGKLAGYRWGLERKRRLLSRERGE